MDTGVALVSIETFENMRAPHSLKSLLVGDTLQLADPGRGFKGLQSADQAIFSFRKVYLQNFWSQLSKMKTSFARPITHAVTYYSCQYNYHAQIFDM